MFLGECSHSLDKKGRFIVPSRFREELGERFVITKGLDKCLFVYTLEEWKELEGKLRSLPISSADARKFTRFFFAGATECEPDKQSRVLLPQNLRDYAGIADEIVSIGVNNRVEIWNKDAWEAYNDEENYIDNQLADKLAELGI
ncbi:MAG: division/cell wall cluster transcriptional repressor MraZ [Firmicutes bacterium]|nr:division/cell wall cluster transcriptional repressor MraZ [Bacillota bacterium]